MARKQKDEKDMGSPPVVETEGMQDPTDDGPPQSRGAEEGTADREEAVNPLAWPFFRLASSVVVGGMSMAEARRQLAGWFVDLPLDKQREMAKEGRKVTERLRLFGEAVDQEFLVITQAYMD